MQLRKGKTKTILESSIESALLAVEIYNKPRVPFRVENYISLMIIAWTKLFHSYFHHTIGNTFYYKKKGSNRYEICDGEKKAWELKTCIKKYGKLNNDVKTNLNFFILLRNKIEHRHISKENIGVEIFGECQSLLYNYENFLIELFGEDYAINENLAFSLQFSKFRTNEQIKANKKILSKDIKDIRIFIEKYRSTLSNEVFNSQNYSIKLIQIPKITNNSRKNVPAIEFVKWNSLSKEDKKNYDKVNAIIKDKVVKTEVINPGKLKPGEIINQVSKKTNTTFSHYDHKCLYYVFSIRPTSDENLDAFRTNTDFCHYDEVHNDYVFQNKWVEFIINIITNNKLSKKEWKSKYKNKEKINIKNYSK